MVVRVEGQLAVLRSEHESVVCVLEKVRADMIGRREWEARMNGFEESLRGIREQAAGGRASHGLDGQERRPTVTTVPSPSEAALRARAVELATEAVGGDAGPVSGDPVFEEVTEGRYR